jgi:two-component system nitrogen regulation sensor histidine kinase NtrY
MMAAASPDIDEVERGSRFSVTPAFELLVLAVAIGIAVASYLVITGQDTPRRLLPPPLVALLLVVNIVPGIALMVILGRRIARRRAARSPIGGEGQLHVRLVVLFSTVAAVPMLLVTIVASLLFQYGVQFWYSDQARGMLDNSARLVRSNYTQTVQHWSEETTLAAANLSSALREASLDDPRMPRYFGQQIYYRGLSDGILFSVSPKNGVQTFLVVNPDLIDVSREVTARQLQHLRAGGSTIVSVRPDRISALTRMPGFADMFLYTATTVNMRPVNEQFRRIGEIQTSYGRLIANARSIQLRFNAALLGLSLLIVGIAVWIALKVADRLVRPVGELVEAARRVEGGDLTARVPDPRTRDEVGTLAKAFNQMTGRLQEQNRELVTANDQLDNRRALIEAVMAGVSAGVVATGADGVVRIANASAVALLGANDAGLVGRRLSEVSPELGALANDGAREAVVQVGQGEARTLAVRIARTDGGPILTFDDITQQVLDQRRAAWADVARRIAHEIKNPLTPIQLAAERLQRRYGGKVAPDDPTFARLTDTIIRQVADLRRMVDEFSSFARMPKPVFRQEALVDTARQALFLHEVAHPSIRFELVHDEPGPSLVCDRRQIGQALTNIVKNAVEAIEAKTSGGDAGEGGGEVVMALSGIGGRSVTVTVADTGVGLPADRDRIIEPYMTTRARGTGLGLAIVNKIIEEHHGTIGFSDRPGGGTVVTMTFDAAALAAQEDHIEEATTDGHFATLSRNRT